MVIFNVYFKGSTWATRWALFWYFSLWLQKYRSSNISEIFQKNQAFFIYFLFYFIRVTFKFCPIHCSYLGIWSFFFLVPIISYLHHKTYCILKWWTWLNLNRWINLKGHMVHHYLCISYALKHIFSTVPLPLLLTRGHLLNTFNDLFLTLHELLSNLDS